MLYYFDKPANAKKFSGKRRLTLPIKIDEDIKNCAKNNNIQVTKFETVDDLNILKGIASDRNEWKIFSYLIYNKAEGDV